MLKKITVYLLTVCVLLGVVGCSSSSKSSNVEGTLEDIMTTLYTDIPEEERPMMLMNTELDDENAEYYLGVKDIPFTEGLASESGVGSIAHSVVIFRVEDGVDAAEAAKQVEENVDPRKWICVEAEKVVVESKGDLVVLVMSTEDTANKILDQFKKLK